MARPPLYAPVLSTVEMIFGEAMVVLWSTSSSIRA
jgi:hypothetical protein